MSNAPKHIREWNAARIAALPAERRSEASGGCEDFTEADWRAYYELHETYGIASLSKEDRARLELTEQRILKNMPPLERNGIKYSAPWSRGVRVAAARKLWPDKGWPKGTVEEIPHDEPQARPAKKHTGYDAGFGAPRRGDH